MKKFFALVAVVMACATMSAAVLWQESLDKNGTYIDKSGSQPWGTNWPYANQWYDAGNFVHEYDSVKSYTVSIRGKKLNQDAQNTIGFYYGAGKEDAKCYLALYGKDGIILANAANVVLKFEICSTESDGGDLDLMTVKVNGEALTVPHTDLGAKNITTTVALPLADGDVESIRISFDNVPSQKFITGLRIEDASEGIENVVLTEKAHKMVVDGVVYIVRDGKMFNLTGTQVR